MFPVTITLNTTDQLNALMAASSGGASMQATPRNSFSYHGEA